MYRAAPEVSTPQPVAVAAVEDLVAAYDVTVVLRGMSFTLEAGRVYGLVGPNGAGKSTLLRCLAGLHRPLRGRVVVDGVDLAHVVPAQRPRIALMSDQPPIYEKLTVVENLRFSAQIDGLAPAELDERVDTCIERVGLGAKRAMSAQSLSLGQRQRLGLARTMLRRSRLMLLDEPANGMDPDARATLAAVLREAAGAGSTVVVSSHVLTELDTVCDAFVVLEGGQVIGAGTARELAGAAPDETFVRVTFLDGVDDLAGRLAAVASSVADVKVTFVEGVQARVRVPAAVEAHRRLLAAVVEAGLPVVEFALERPHIAEVYAHRAARGAERSEP